jgi:bifunctional non-homologous end joining protein LigD
VTLARYRKKRDFSRTSEPRGRRAKQGWLYVVQKHAARRLHYDLRLQIGDVLKSWAVPKGPSLDPDVRRLAVHVEDHPVEYGSFEGTIPASEYGGGTVMLWDRGTWEIEGDPLEQYRQGKLHFTLHGKKLRGEWVLVRKSGTAGEDKEPWFFFKVRDGEAREGDDDRILREEPNSAASGRDLEQIAAGKKVWRGVSGGKQKTRSQQAAAPPMRKTPKERSGPQGRKKQLARLREAKTAPLPGSIRPQLATLVKTPPQGDQWLNEIKFDGYRMLCRVDKGNVTFSSRNGLDWTARLEHLVRAVRGLGVGSAIFDGEVVSLDADGRSSFQGMQTAMAEKRGGQLIYYVFDVLYLDGKNLMKVPLEERKNLLDEVIAGESGPVRNAGYVVGHGPEFYAQAQKMKLEGIICKRRDGIFRPGRSAEWLKVKSLAREEFVIGGFTPPAGARVGFGALLVGYYDEHRRLVYAGRVGTGFSDELLASIVARLKTLEQKQSPFVDFSDRTVKARTVHWVEPKLVAQVAFGDWTRDGRLRQPSFQGLREDKPATEVRRERAVPLATVEKALAKDPPQARSSHPHKHANPNGSPAMEIPASVRLTHPDKVLYPGDEITKAQVAGYYAHIAEWILPHVVDRPLTLVRCPDGYTGECFFQKHTRKGMPEVLKRVKIADKKKVIEYPVVENLEALLSLVQMNTLEIHLWGARIDNVERPDRLVFDLDPDPSVPWKRLVESARQLRDFLEQLDLVTFLKTTGGKGLHLVLPIERRTTWDEAKGIAHAIATAAERADPGRYTTQMAKAARPGKIFIDYLRNMRGATWVAPYSTRARAGCPISTPISWEELSSITSADQFRLDNLPQRLAALKRDPWHDLATTKQALSKSLVKKLGAG